MSLFVNVLLCDFGGLLGGFIVQDGISRIPNRGSILLLAFLLGGYGVWDVVSLVSNKRVVRCLILPTLFEGQ